LWGENINTTKKNAKVLLDVSKEVGLEVYSDESKVQIFGYSSKKL
jgi:hypothetical protein